MDGGDPAMPTSKRPRLDSANTAYIAAHPPPPTTQPSSAQSARHSSLSTTPVHPSPPPNRHYQPPPPPLNPHHPPPPHSRPPHQPYSLPAPPPPPPPQYPQHHQPQQPPQHQSPSHPQLPHPSQLPPPNPSHRINGPPGTPVTHSVRVSQDNIDTYRPSPTPQPASAPEPPPSRAHSVHEDPRMANTNPSSPWHANPDPRNGPPIPNGYHTMSPPNQVEQPFHAPPTQPGQHYAPPPSVGGYNQSSYMSPQQYASTASTQMRRKQVRATQACNHCRSRKQKCDEARPCQFCRENNFDCQYKDVPVPKQDRTMMQLQEGQNEIAATLKTFIDSFNIWKQSIETRLPPTNGSDGLAMSMEQPSPGNAFDARGSMSERRTSQMPTPAQPRSQLSRVNSMKTESPNALHSHLSPVPTTASTPVKQEAPVSTFQPPPTPVGSLHRSQSTGDNPEGLQSDHTTPAHMLLPRLAAQWNLEQRIPELKALTDDNKPITDYPLHYEQDRGLLRVWGVGEGHDQPDCIQGGGSPASYSGSDVASPAPVPQKENQLYPAPTDQSSPSTVSGDTIQESVGGMGPDGRPDFRQATLQKLRKEYETHIHVLHPFMNAYQLERMINEFGALYSPEARATHAAMSPAGADRLHPGGLKRKRSISMYGDGFELPPKGFIAKSLRNGIVLLVLALGKVCEYKGPLPGPQSDRNPLSNGAGSYYRDSPRSWNGSFHSDDGDVRQRNIDIIPGMAYFSLATDILGNQTAGNTLAHAQANLLAALYIAQFARVVESWSWISNACRIALVLIKADYTHINRDLLLRSDTGENGTAPSPVPTVPRKDRQRLNTVKVIYYTCLQLETDILAELSTLPPTGISNFQSDIFYPEGVDEHANGVQNQAELAPHSDPVFFIYSTMISLRVLLNGAHNSLYSAMGNPQRNTLLTARTMATILEHWRRGMPGILSWDDKEPPSTDLSVARMRAKVYGAKYVILRPVLFSALEKIKEPRHERHSSVDSPASIAAMSASTPGTDGAYANSEQPSKKASGDNPQTLANSAHECIEAAVQSTIAFDRVGASPNEPYKGYVSNRKCRLIVTNITGTLHAQFGNMIVLAAVWSSPLVTWLPPNSALTKENLSQLFHRTISILDEMAPNSPILRIDRDILLEIKRQLDL